MITLHLQYASFWTFAGVVGVSNTLWTGRDMVLKNGPGSLRPLSWTTPSWKISIGNSLTSQEGRQEASVRGRVLLWFRCFAFSSSSLSSLSLSCAVW